MALLPNFQQNTSQPLYSGFLNTLYFLPHQKACSVIHNRLLTGFLKSLSIIFFLLSSILERASPLLLQNALEYTHFLYVHLPLQRDNATITQSDFLYTTLFIQFQILPLLSAKFNTFFGIVKNFISISVSQTKKGIRINIFSPYTYLITIKLLLLPFLHKLYNIICSLQVGKID